MTAATGGLRPNVMTLMSAGVTATKIPRTVSVLNAWAMNTAVIATPPASIPAPAPARSVWAGAVCSKTPPRSRGRVTRVPTMKAGTASRTFPRVT